ncbi:MAG TPA: hypothetical protein VKE96_12090, partial [Vicinamibacterales bacterium]|nr:hypothetical protein [Vicinamibacterales bacterium]
ALYCVMSHLSAWANADEVIATDSKRLDSNALIPSLLLMPFDDNTGVNDGAVEFIEVASGYCARIITGRGLGFVGSCRGSAAKASRREDRRKTGAS